MTLRLPSRRVLIALAAMALAGAGAVVASHAGAPAGGIHTDDSTRAGIYTDDSL